MAVHTDICKNCGGIYGFHRAGDHRCPENGVEAVSGSQWWQHSFFEPQKRLHCPECGYAFFPGLEGPGDCPHCSGIDKKPLDIETVKERLGVSEAEIGKMFGYKNARSFHEAHRRPKIEAGVVKLFKIFLTKTK